ncbi:bifunctional phosphopantothenoylcysteine decarboxylase/phosphopantothenate--cysteine ligase CoaBC [Nesterenkonia sphaerica]|uniref:Coenzyme A biosynthesis bifunctional protein CoaBC n=1 Tax=Nesterenkonia sphaerica TaxID=1804988 RepID=A0A5R9ALX5_9MICC|nr:bifunctional phosphopantothenoylcysteine decarboxylase/phosphopantothenate--cysteine ligase CoaBC [Nesterenkonia sphaerica]TLP79410.1 bifunctional phosphopantothenoylcysteine decarboxylase/phosphopantothenate--cysteine ligase CoaBC [Nesterenkonia sphaerica]
MRIVLGVSAGIAAYKSVHLARLLKEDGHQVDVIPTSSSLEFVGRATWEAISGRPVSTTVFEGVDEVRHVRLGQEADLVVVAPATADLLAKIRAGMADDLMTTTLLATEAPTLLVPAMHTEMWRNAATRENVAGLRARGIEVMEPAVGRLTGKDSGPGRMPEPSEIYARVQQLLEPDHAESLPAGTLNGRRVLVSAGGTREPLDPVRFLGNRSSGKQGLALARAAQAAGAEVTLVAGSMASGVDLGGIDTISAETTEQMHAAVLDHAAESDVLIMAAAVADFRPAGYTTTKIKKTDDAADPVIQLQRNPDILAEVVQRRAQSGGGPEVIVGFAAETGDDTHAPLELAEQKLARKGCDLLVLNHVGENLVFGQDTTEIHILASEHAQRMLGEAHPLHVTGSKAQAAEAVVAQAARLLSMPEG